MQRTKSNLAQITFDLAQALHGMQRRSGRILGFGARIAGRLARPLAKQCGSGYTITARVYGRDLVMPAEHPLPRILLDLPQYNRPLALAAVALARTASTGEDLVIVDVGANIGDTVAIIEQQLPDRCVYLCIEPEPDMAQLCRSNYQDLPQVQVEEAFVGEQEGATVRLQDDGRANPSTMAVQTGGADEAFMQGRLQRLDTLALPFAARHGTVSLIKVDTEGYDFSVLRSGSELLRRYQPELFLEWYPELLERNAEPVWQGFEYLRTLGYRYFVFYTNEGDFYCKAVDPDRQFFRSLATVTQTRSSLPYFDVCLTTKEEVCSQLTELSIAKSNSDRTDAGDAQVDPLPPSSYTHKGG